MQPNANEQPDQQGFYNPGKQPEGYNQSAPAVQPPAPDFDDGEEVSWQASEYVHRTKDVKWVIGFLFVFAVLLGITIWVREWIFAVLVVVMGTAMGYFAFRPPQTKHYTLTHHSLKIDDKVYELKDYRAFGILPEEGIYTVMLLPTGRFKPALSVYFAEEDGEKIVDILSQHMPAEELHSDPIDAIMRRLHF